MIGVGEGIQYEIKSTQCEKRTYKIIIKLKISANNTDKGNSKEMLSIVSGQMIEVHSVQSTMMGISQHVGILWRFTQYSLQ